MRVFSKTLEYVDVREEKKEKNVNNTSNTYALKKYLKHVEHYPLVIELNSLSNEFCYPYSNYRRVLKSMSHTWCEWKKYNASDIGPNGTLGSLYIIIDYIDEKFKSLKTDNNPTSLDRKMCNLASIVLEAYSLAEYRYKIIKKGKL